MSEQPILNLSADRPIASIKEDRLGRGEFVIALANALRYWQGEESLVIALYGPWGSGKTSIKNMVIELMRGAHPAPTVVEFNPWSWSGHNRLTTAFLNEIGIAIETDVESADAKAVAEKWKRYSARLELSGIVLDNLRTAAEVMGIPWAPLLLGGAAKATEGASQLTKNAADVQEHSAASPEETASKMKDALAEALKKLKAPIIVVMDDVDRLTKDEIPSLFQLIKANGDLPRLVYLLLYDRRIVEDSLNQISAWTGHEYMEKIVQVGFDVPPVDTQACQTVLLDGLNRLLNIDGVGKHFDREYWAGLFVEGMSPFFTTLRDVQRFLSTISFQVMLFYRDGTFEVNPVDLIALEVLRLFEPNVYHSLPRHRDLLLGTGNRWYGESSKISVRKQQIEDFINNTATEERREAVSKMLQRLFPVVGWTVRNQSHGMGFEAGWMGSLRVCHPELFDRYFILKVPAEDVSQHVLDKVLKAADETVALNAVLDELSNENKLLAARGETPFIHWNR